ncbi:MAG: ddl, D-alanyl-alanine synthetase D-alanine-D-alanine ligase [Candidatus Saccharibacteria bacterium]|nr:ddl, D-alanyl-alanine synthetase D-alanine-D-alanine ligase [Candidatus Saccharibacteria bacterium]
MQRPTVLLLFGGESSEHEVSISSARNVYAALDDTKFDVVLCFIDKQGKWHLLTDLGMTISTHDAPQLVPALGSACFMTVPASHMIKPDVILPVLHGKNGEDGSVQGLAQLLHIPIVGCDMTASAICMDKLATKQILAANDILIVDFEVHRQGEPKPDFAVLSAKLGNSLFVKPARAGSSVGVSKVTSETELDRALNIAHQHDTVVLIERGIMGREIEVAVLGNPPKHQASRPGEIMADGEFYSYDSKYSSTSGSTVTIPAEMNDETEQRIRDLALRVYALLGCKGLARVDFFLLDDGTVYLNEVNTIPGFTNISMYPKLWRQAGLGYPELIERLISDALDA